MAFEKMNREFLKKYIFDKLMIPVLLWRRDFAFKFIRTNVLYLLYKLHTV